jgi:hypothetical protein
MKSFVIVAAAAALAACAPANRTDTLAAPPPGAAPPAASAEPAPSRSAAPGQPAGTAPASTTAPSVLKEEDRSPFSRPKFEVRPPEPQRWYSTGRRYE